MPELLLEVGSEELPASFVRKAYTDLRQGLTTRLREAGVLRAEGTAMGTPRRLIVSFPDLEARQADQTKEQRGPSLKGAYDAEGNPTPALLGFCRGQGVSPEDLRNDGQYVWATKTVPGRPTDEILAEAIPQAIRALSFEKSMRWGASRMRFARPIRWILASFDGVAVAFDIEGVPAGTASRGHRFYSPEAFEAASLEALLTGLRERHVEPDPEARERRIREGAGEAPSPALVEENTFLTEWPTVVEGSFREEFLELPEPVLVTAMAKHEKMFPVRGEGGRLLNRFRFVRNSGEEETVRRGNEWVLNARLQDARFFFDEDRKHTLEELLEKTSGIVFAERLGTVRQRADRLAQLAEAVARATGAEEEEEAFARQAGRLCKADLSAGLVSELPDLQGIVGGEYARREGFPEPVCWAIGTHYDLSKNPSVDSVSARTAVRATVADALDKLSGYLGLGLAPTGSSDPYALRRAATTLIEVAWGWPGAFSDLGQLLSLAIHGYREQGFELDREGATIALAELFATRFPTLLPEVRHDVLEAALMREQSPGEALAPRGVRFRVRCLEATVDDVPFVQAMTRPLNIVAAARKKKVEFAGEEPLKEVDLAALDSPEGAALYEVLRAQEDDVERAACDENVGDTLALHRRLAEPIGRFFDATMVMVDDPAARYARLTLLHACSLQILWAGDFSKIVVEG